MAEEQPTDIYGSADEAYALVEAMSAAPLWRHYRGLFPDQPRSSAQPVCWSFQEIRRLMLYFNQHLSLEDAERRVLMMINPQLTVPATLSTLFAGVQCIMPGETARPHRHAANAFRFIIEGSGAQTTVNGEPVPMEPGDLLLTPGWCWHDHTHLGDEPMFWLDGLDYPLVNMLENAFFEALDAPQQDTTMPPDISARSFSHGRLNPTWLAPVSDSSSPIGRYPWSQTRNAFDAIGDEVEGSAYDGIKLEYVNPWNGSSVLPSIACHVARLPPAFAGRPRRSTANTIFCVVEGAGRTKVGGEAFAWKPGDVFAVPSWTSYQHQLEPDKTAILFSYSDEPLRKKLGLFREESM